MKGATSVQLDDYDTDFISIHAPNEGSDIKDMLKAKYLSDISIHAPNEGSDSKNAHITLILIVYNAHFCEHKKLLSNRINTLLLKQAFYYWCE